MMTKKKYYKVLVTRDTTESCVIPVAAHNAQDAGEAVFDPNWLSGFSGQFEPNEGILGEGAYLGDPDEDVTEISKEEYDALLVQNKEFANRILYLEAYAVSDYGDGPRYAEYEITTQTMQKILAMQKLCINNDLSECRIFDGPQWDGEDELRLTGHVLVVTNDSFWFVACPKHVDYHVETRAMPIDRLVLLASTEIDTPEHHDIYHGDIYYGDNPGDLQNLIEQEKSKQ